VSVYSVVISSTVVILVLLGGGLRVVSIITSLPSAEIDQQRIRVVKNDGFCSGKRRELEKEYPVGAPQTHGQCVAPDLPRSICPMGVTGPIPPLRPLIEPDDSFRRGPSFAYFPKGAAILRRWMMFRLRFFNRATSVGSSSARKWCGKSPTILENIVAPSQCRVPGAFRMRGRARKSA